MKKGRISQIIGPVIDVEFSEGELPEIYNAIKIIRSDQSVLILEVQQHLGENIVRCVSMDSTEGMIRGMEALDTGEPISVPVGPQVLGRLINVVGEPIDELGEVSTEKRYPIHRPAPKYEDLNTSSEILETGILLLTP